MIVSMNDLLQIIENATGLTASIQLKFIKTFVILLFLWGLRRIILKIIWHQTEDVKTRYLWRKTLTYINLILAFLLIGFVWINGLKYLSTYLGLLSAGIAIALKDPIVNIIGWFYLITQKSFVVGDRIQIGEIKGDVIDIRLSQFLLMEIGNWVDAEQSTGRIIYVPNNLIFQQTLANYTTGFEYIWNEIPLTITFESNWQKARTILEEIVNNESEKITKTAGKEVRRASKKFMIYYKHLTPIVYMKTNDFGVVFTMRYLTNPRHRRGSEEKIWYDILMEFTKHKDIDFAYPTQRFYNNVTEGKQ